MKKVTKKSSDKNAGHASCRFYFRRSRSKNEHSRQRWLAFITGPRSFLTVLPFSFPAAERLLGESGKTMVALRVGKGKADLPEVKDCASNAGANSCGPWF